MGVLNRADFLKGAFRVCTAVAPCDTKQHKNYVKFGFKSFPESYCTCVLSKWAKDIKSEESDTLDRAEKD